jgi:hypothetical protein
MDFFGYERETYANGQIMSSEVAILSLGGSPCSLVQSVQSSYTQRVEPKFEGGSANLFWVTGQPQGVIDIGAFVGSGGFNLLSKANGNEGNISGVDASLLGAGGLSFKGAVVESVRMSYQAGTLVVEEGMTIKAASMSR